MVIDRRHWTEIKPRLLDDWDYSKNNVSPFSVKNGSGRLTHWKCKVCGYEWQSTFRNRFRSKGECLYCSKKVPTVHYNLSLKYPDKAVYWDFEKNNKPPTSFLPTSRKKVWWKCDTCGYSWIESIVDVVSREGVCKNCNSVAVCFPELATEYSDKNSAGIEKLSKSSHKKVLWLCSTCSREWGATVKNRATNKSGCPYCSGREATEVNNLLVVFPAVAVEWSNRNKKITPEDVLSYSAHKAWWKCSVCGYEWKAFVYNRTINDSGCPACANRVATSNNNLTNTNPLLLDEWDFKKNHTPPYKYVGGSDKRVWWRCSKCSYEWKTQIKARVKRGCSCPRCSKAGVSKKSQKWLSSLNIKSLLREYRIVEFNYWVDGFDPETNTVYEFLGDFWHGNPRVYNPEDFNGVNKKLFGTLYKEWVDRKTKLEKKGYKVKYIWEKDFRKVVI